MGTPLPMPRSARWGGRGVNKLAARPGRGRSTHGGAEEKSRGCWDAPAQVRGGTGEGGTGGKGTGGGGFEGGNFVPTIALY